MRLHTRIRPFHGSMLLLYQCKELACHASVKRQRLASLDTHAEDKDSFLTFDLCKGTRRDQGIVVDALEDVLVQLLGLGAIKGHAQDDEGVSQALHTIQFRSATQIQSISCSITWR